MDISKLKGHVPDAVIAQIPEVMDKFQINTPLRLCHFMKVVTSRQSMKT
jgi:putative chitinase